MKEVKGKQIAFTGGLLIDGNGKAPIENSLVLIEDKKIKYAGKMKPLEGEAVVVYDVLGKTIMPGLIDTHLHYSGNLSDDDTEWVLEPIFQKAVVAVSQAREALENGLT
ncbi:MAG: amidohydrolase family protein, partial [Anaerovorax sp.]